MAAAGDLRSFHRQTAIPLEARHRARGGVCARCPSADAVVGPWQRRRLRRRRRRLPLLFCARLPSGWRAGGAAGRPWVSTFPPLAALGCRPLGAPVRPDGGGPSPPGRAAAHAGRRTCAHAVRGRSRWSYLGRSRGGTVVAEPRRPSAPRPALRVCLERSGARRRPALPPRGPPAREGTPPSRRASPVVAVSAAAIVVRCWKARWPRPPRRGR